MRTVWLVYGLLTIIYVSFILINNRRLRDGRSPIRASKWSFSDAWLMFTVTMIFASVSMVFFYDHTASTHQKLDFWRVVMPSSIGQDIGAIFVTIYVVCRLYGIHGRELGYQFNGRELLRGLLIGLPTGMVVTCFAITVYVSLYFILGQHMMMKFVEFNNQLNQSGLIFQQIKTNAQSVAFVIMACVAAPLGEEFFFRGWLFNAVKFRSNNVMLACVVSGVIFACIHIAPLNVIVIIPLGMWLAWNYHKSGSIWRNIGIHAAYNLLVVAVTLIARSLGHNLDKVF